jgi:TatD DNase family protein
MSNLFYFCQMKFVNLHTHKFSNQENILEVVNQSRFGFNENIPNFSIGIHPWKIENVWVNVDLEFTERGLKYKNCIAIGECGLDKRIEIPFDLQVEVFEKQLLLAQKYNKPVILHCVGAFQEIIETKKRLKIEVPMIIHGFSKNEQIAKQLLDNGFYLSFGKYLIQNPELETVFKNIPFDCFFLETDSSDYSIEEVYAAAAKIKNIEIDLLKRILYTNFLRLFDLK